MPRSTAMSRPREAGDEAEDSRSRILSTPAPRPPSEAAGVRPGRLYLLRSATGHPKRPAASDVTALRARPQQPGPRQQVEPEPAERAGPAAPAAARPHWRTRPSMPCDEQSGQALDGVCARPCPSTRPRRGRPRRRAIGPAGRDAHRVSTPRPRRRSVARPPRGDARGPAQPRRPPRAAAGSGASMARASSRSAGFPRIAAIDDHHRVRAQHEGPPRTPSAAEPPPRAFARALRSASTPASCALPGSPEPPRAPQGTARPQPASSSRRRGDARRQDKARSPRGRAGRSRASSGARSAGTATLGDQVVRPRSRGRSHARRSRRCPSRGRRSRRSPERSRPG